MIKYPESEEKFIFPKNECQIESKYSVRSLEPKLIKKLQTAGLYVDPRSIINEHKEVIPPLIGVSEVSVMAGWEPKKTSVYIKRNILPDPCMYVGGRPCWTIKQIEEWLQNPKNKKYID